MSHAKFVFVLQWLPKKKFFVKMDVCSSYQDALDEAKQYFSLPQNKRLLDLTLWRPSHRLDVLPDEPLDDFANQANFVDNLPQPYGDKHIDVIVELSVEVAEKPKSEKRGDNPSERYRRLVNATREGPTPSELAKSNIYANKQEGMDPIYDGRYAEGHPRDTLTLPAMFYHPAFARFLDEIRDPDLEVPDGVVEASNDFINKSSVIYPSENTRRDAFLPSLNKAVGHTFLTLSNSDKTQPDGVVPLKSGEIFDNGDLKSRERCRELVAATILVALREDKNEIGRGGSDPSIQGVLSTSRFWVLPEHDDIRNATCCPTVVLATAGPFIMVMAVVITDKVIVQRLTNFVYTGRELDSGDLRCVQVAKIFYALGKCISRLATYYATVSPSNIEPDSQHPRFFPSIMSYNDNSSLRSFRYVHHLEQDASCVTFLAQETGEQKKYIVVKFVQRYGIAAHQHLAGAGFAPLVYYFGPVGQGDAPSYGEYQMVVMEWIDGKSAADLATKGKLPASFLAQLRQAVDFLHESQYVFGDLRYQNVMVRHDGKIKLVDFDWAGIHGQAKYPLQMNMDIRWPRGVGPRKIMLMSHDIAMLDSYIIQGEPKGPT